ncbi:MAG: cyclomaltodextrinase C-terminal domain-containing protein [Thalassotalea sp.]|nr:cyclomaltodextrinase C-terminal domain-containing protein [Thalassotalea sp.]
MSNPGTDDHGIIRTDFPGGWQGDKVNGFSNKGLSEAQKAAKRFMRTLLNWRKNTPAVHQGKLRHYGPENGVYVYFRYDDNEQYMIVINKNTQDTAISLERFDEMLSNANSLMPIALDANSLTKSQKANGDLVIPKKSAQVFAVK